MIDAKQLNAAYQEALGNIDTPKDMERAKRAGVETDTGDAARMAITAETFCAAWPRVYRFLIVLLNSFGWIAPTLSAKARAAIVTINRVVIPMICTPAP